MTETTIIFEIIGNAMLLLGVLCGLEWLQVRKWKRINAKVEQIRNKR